MCLNFRFSASTFVEKGSFGMDDVVKKTLLMAIPRNDKSGCLLYVDFMVARNMINGFGVRG